MLEKNLVRVFATLMLAILLTAALVPAAQAQNPGDLSPARVAEFKKRFQHGRKLLDEGKPEEALAVFNGILKEVPDAKGSLYLAGFANLQLGRYEQALVDLDKFRRIEPKDTLGLIWSIQAHQALGQSQAVETLRKELYALRNDGPPVKDLTDKLMYPRERMDRGDGLLIIGEYFDPEKAPNILYTAEVVNGSGELQRRLFVSYDPAATQKAVASGKIKPGSKLYYFGEMLIEDGEFYQRNIYKEIQHEPIYERAKFWFNEALMTTPEPIWVEQLKPRPVPQPKTREERKEEQQETQKVKEKARKQEEKKPDASPQTPPGMPKIPDLPDIPGLD